jgi:ABC-type spermidine/putrescine transport system permease subunit I
MKAGDSDNHDGSLSTSASAAQIVLIALFYFCALGYCVLLSLGLRVPVDTFSIDLSSYRDTFGNPLVRLALLNSLKIGLTLALIVLPVALLAARCILALRSALARSVVAAVFFLPLLSNSLIRMLGYRALISEEGSLASMYVGLIGRPFPITPYTEAAVMLGLVSSVLPLGIAICLIALLRVEEDVVAAARNLGANPAQVFFRIEVPQCYGALLIAAQFCVISALADVFAQSALGGNQSYTFAVAIADRIKINDWPGASALAIGLMCLVVGLMSTITVTRAFQRGVSK